MPHIAVPLRRVQRPDGSGQGLALYEQDSPEEIDACVFAVLNTPLGHRIDLPEFGTPDQAFRRGGADLAAIERTLAVWEPRADAVASRDPGRFVREAESVSSDTVRVSR